MVVSVEEKAHKMCQVWIRKLSESKPLTTYRKIVRWRQNPRGSLFGDRYGVAC